MPQRRSAGFSRKSMTRSSRNRAEVSLQQHAATGIRSRTVTDYATANDSDHGAGRLRLRRERRAAIGFAADDSTGVDPAQTAEGLRVLRRRGRCATSRSRQPVQSRRQMDGRLRWRVSVRRRTAATSVSRRCRAVQKTRPDRRNASPADGPGQRAGRTCRRHRAVLRIARRRLAVLRASRSRSIENALPGGHSPAYFAILNQPLPNTPDHVAQRSGVVRGVPGVLPRARSRPPVVGTGGRLAQLPRAVAQRRVRAVLRRALRAANSAATMSSAA